MALDELLRDLAGEVPAPPSGDAAEVFQRGVRRRRARRAARVGGAASVVAAIGLSGTLLLPGPRMPDIADRPSDGTPVTDVEPAGSHVAFIRSDPEEPFGWIAAVAATEDGDWCASAFHGASDGVVEGSCHLLLTPEQAGDPRGLGSTGVQVEPGVDGRPSRGVTWGLAATPVDRVVIEFTDGSRRDAQLSPSIEVGATLWAIGYEGTDVHAVEAYTDGVLVAGYVVLD